MKADKARERAELSGKATNVLDARTLSASHGRLEQLLAEGMSVLDAGCGTGAITRGIAGVVGSSGRVVGTDNNPELIAKARQAGGDVPGLSFDVCDIYALPYEDEFDIVTSSRVLQWLADPLQALRAMKAAARPGGRVLVLDYNHEKIVWEPEPPASMRSFYAAFLRWRSDAGMDNSIADRLPGLFREAGLRDITATPRHETARRGDGDFMPRIGIWADVAASRGLQMVKDGYVTEDERAAAEDDYREWVRDAAVSQTLYLLAVEGVKA
ncbi:methyltransferase domain-containing protein [Paenibacillus sp. GYB003]|uniref:methyltransferase domain-containing protein n=1 Tax=Paenibacillus sp. GYB003 TaxID=2994392 RepID=UPI002F9645EB